MSFRRVPFKFTTTDPVERQRELERRFGLPSSRNMFDSVDNPLSTGIVTKESVTSSSPRLQHRVPIFVEGSVQPVHSSVDSMAAASENKKSNVRVIPIEIEGSESRPSSRHRTNSGPAGVANGRTSQKSDIPPIKRPLIDLLKPSMTKATAESKVHNIPIQVEGANNLKHPKFDKVSKSSQKDSPKVDGYTVSKTKTVPPVKEHNKKPETIKDIHDVENLAGIKNSLKQIASIWEEFKTYKAQVQEFSGNTKDKQYRYLDEMLTRCILKLDDVDTMGNDGARSCRKNAVRNIQACIDLLEKKASGVNEVVNNLVSENVVKSSEIIKNEVKTSENEVKSSEIAENEVKTSEIQATNEILVERCEENSECQTDVEMKEHQTADAELLEDTPKPEVVLSEDATNTREQPTVEIPSEVPEVEMADIDAVSSRNLNSNVIEMNEVEMVDIPSEPNVDSDSTFPESEETEKIANAQVNTSSQEDIETKDVQRTLDEVKNSVVEEIVDNCTSSHAEEECKCDMGIEKNTSMENEGMSLCSGDYVCKSDVGTCDSDI